MENDAIKCQTREASPADKYDFYSGKQESTVHAVTNTGTSILANRSSDAIIATSIK